MSDDATGSSRGAVPAGAPEHDAWLREALRHAPDASVLPPASLRESIMAEARAATRPRVRNAPATSMTHRFAAFWSWLARPPVAAGFASVMAATLLGLMWWDRPIDEALPHAPASVVATAAPTAEADKQTSASPTPAPFEGPATASPSTTTPPATPTLPATTVERAQRRAVAAPQAAPAERVAVSPAKTGAAAGALREESKDEARALSNAAPAAPVAQAPPAAPAPFPLRDQRNDDARAAPGRAEPAALAKKAEKRDAEENRETAASDNRLAAQAPPIAAARERAAEATASAPARPMASLLAALAGDAGRWSRPTSSSDRAAIDGAVRAWLARVDAAATQWQPLVDRPSRPDSALASTPEANTLLLYRDGRPGAIVRIEDGGVVFEPRPGPAWFAPLAPEVVARLRASLPAATR